MTPTLQLTFFFSFLLISSAQNLRKTAVFQDPITVLNELDNKHFGNALISAIAVHLSANSPIDSIVTLLNNLKENLQKDQEKSKGLNITDQRECEKMLSDFSENLEYHQSQLKSEEELKEKSEIFLQKCFQTLVHAGDAGVAERQTRNHNTKNHWIVFRLRVGCSQFRGAS